MKVKTGGIKLRSCCGDLSPCESPNEESLKKSCDSNSEPKFLMGDMRRLGGDEDVESDSMHNQSTRRPQNLDHNHPSMSRRHKDKFHYQKTWKWKMGVRVHGGKAPSFYYLFLLSLLGLLYLMTAVEGTDEDWTTKCPSRCKCIWASGRKSVECRDVGYTTIPEGLSDEIQALDLSGNRIPRLTRHIFREAGLLNLQRIFLKNCGIEAVDGEAFQDLKILVELDLSGNNISQIQMETFSSNERLRELYLNENPLTKLSGNQFPPLVHLKILSMRDCRLSQFNRKSFQRLQNLEQLDLSGNLFEYLHEDLLEPLKKLISLNLRNNPWRCDCRLQSFRQWVMGRNVLSSGTKCAEPDRIANHEWNVLVASDFACKPEILTLQISGQATDALIVGDVGKDITLECRVRANPTPDVRWVRDSQAISNSTILAQGRAYTVHISGDTTDRWVNLTIQKSQPSDAGEYTCVGSNPGGFTEKNITLNFQDVPSGAGVGIGVGGTDSTFRDHSWLWILLIILAVLLTVTMVVLAVCVCNRRRRVKTARSQDLKGGQQQPLVDHRSIEDSTPGDGTKGDGNTPLLTKGFPSGNVDVGDPSDYPDLLNLPNRPQESPAGSNSSTVPDSTRLIMPQQLNPAALYDPAGNAIPLNYRHPGILHHHPMGRPHSPYSGSVASFTSEPPQVIIPVGNRPGYVTLPRRPRVPSWSPASHSHYPSLSTPLPPPSPTGSSISGMGPFIGPKYDNLGPRTTADGSSKLSLNKVGLGGGSEPSTPLNSATLPMPGRNRSAALPYHSPAPHFNFAPIQEHEGPTTPTENNHHNYGLPLPENEPPLSTLPRSWRPTESPQSNKSTRSNVVPEEEKSGVSSPLSPNSQSGKKVPPLPPPKPKKGNLSKETSLDTPNTSIQGDEGTEV